MLSSQVFIIAAIAIVAFLSTCDSTVYYVIPDEEHHNCTGECHMLSYYTSKTDWNSNTTLIFLSGEHNLTANLTITGLYSVILQGESYSRNGLPVISSADSSFGLSIQLCHIVSFKSLVIKSPLMSLEGNIRVNIAHVSTTGSIFLNSFHVANSSVILSGSQVVSNSDSVAAAAVYVHFVANLLIHETLISNKYGNGLFISCNRAIVKLDNVSVSNNNGSGIKVAAYERNVVSFISINVSGNNGTGLFIRCYKTDVIPENDVAVSLNQYNSISANGITSINNSGRGLAVYCHDFGHCDINLKEIAIVNSIYQGIKVLCNRSNIVTISNVTVQNCYIGMYIGGNLNNSIIISDAIVSNNAEGIHIKFVNHGNTITFNGLSSTGNVKFGLVGNSNYKNYYNLILANITNNYKSGLALRCGQGGTVKLIGVNISNNADSGLILDGSCNLEFLVHPSMITNNRSPSNGGGMRISRSTVITSDTVVYLINNTANGVGGAIYVTNIEVSTIIEYCTFNKFHPVFENNTAVIAGNNIYNGVYWSCYIKVNKTSDNATSSSNNFIDKVNCASNIIFYQFKKPLSNYVTSIPIGVCMCDSTSTVDCNTRSIARVFYPGQSITLSLVTVGLCGGLSPSVLVTSNTSGVGINIAGNNHETQRNCKSFTYQINRMDYNMDKDDVKIGIRNSEIHFTGSQFTMNITFYTCPLGLQIVSGVCQCDSIIDSVNETHCDINNMPHPISRSGNNWLYYSEEYQCVVAQSNCPFDYCDTSTVHLSLNESHLQCTNGRSGILCGGCQEGLSLTLGSNKCEHCSNNYIALVVTFIIAGISLVVFLMVSNLTVSVGSINGLLFYTNIVKLNEAALFPNGVSIPVLSQFIAWLNLDLGIQTCFFSGLDGYWKAWLQFLFPLYIWLLIIGVIVLSHYSGRVSRLCGNNAVPVLATLVFMSYTKLLRLITNILMLAIIKCKQEHWFVWSVDGNIDYLRGKHIPLFMVALLFLLIGLLYTVLVFSAQWLQRYSGKCFKSSRDPVIKLKPFIDAYTGPYKDKYRYWTGLLLIVRLLLTTVFSYTTGTIPQINNYIIAAVAAILLYKSRGIYVDGRLNILEAFYLINLGIMAQLNILSDSMNLRITGTVTAVSISLSILVFILTIILHAFNRVKKRFSLNCCTVNMPLRDEEEKKPLLQEEELHSPACEIMRRESLIFDFDI